MASVGSLSEEKKVGDGAEKALSSKVSVNEKPVSPLSSETPLPPDEALKAKEKNLLWKIDYHLIPILFALYMFAFLDRVNIGNAKIQGLTTDLKMNGAMYNVASEILFVPYILLEVPSNLIIKRIRPSYWLSGLMFFWGITTVCQGVVSSYGGLLVCRVFLGVFEAGIFPGCAYLISMYYKRFELQRRLVLFFTSSMLAGAFGGLLAYALSHMAGLGGYNGWRWIFIIEGLATIVVAVAGFFLIADWPEQAKFLTEDEKAFVASRIAEDNAHGTARMDTLDRPALKRIFSDWKIWCGTVIYMCVTTTGYATNFFMPTILTQLGWRAADAQLHTIPIYGVGFIVTLACSWWSDRIQHRYAFTVVGLTIACIGYVVLLCEAHVSIGARYTALFLVNVGNYITQPLAVVWLANNIGGHYKRAFSTALQIGLGNIGGIIGSNIFLANEAPRYPTGYGTGLGLLLLGIVLCTAFWQGLKLENKKRDRGERDYRLSLPEVENLGDDHPEFRYNS